MEREKKIHEILCVAMNVQAPKDAPIYTANFIGLSPAGEILVSGLSPTGETFAPIPGAIVIRCPLNAADQKEIEDIKNGI